MADAAEIRRNLEHLLAGAAKALALEVTAELVKACPVDTGHARRNFVPSIGSPADSEDDGAAQQEGMAAVVGYAIGGGDLYVTNHVPYIDHLILGSSQQQPAGWDLAAVDRAEQKVAAEWGVRIDVTSSADVSARGNRAAAGMAEAFSPFGGDE